jgi:hypothetical protein
MGSVGLVPWIAHPLFVVLLGAGWFTREIGHAGLVTFVALWLLGFFIFDSLLRSGGMLFPAYVAILDVVLVLLVFKGDVRLH